MPPNRTGYNMQREEIETETDSSDDSDVSMTSDDDSDESDSLHQESADSADQQEAQGADAGSNKSDEEEEEDEVIKAIMQERDKKRDRPPNIICEDYVVDVCFHPVKNLIALGLITGDVLIYEYTNEENKLISTQELHVKACRDIEFDSDGKVLYSVGKDKVIMLTDIETEKLKRCYEDSHEAPLYCITVIDDNLFATGDDDGVVKLWDNRQNTDKSILSMKKNEDYISDIITNDQKKYLVCSSGDGSITTIDLHNNQFKMQSEEYDNELTCLGLFRQETKLLAGSSKGKMYLFNWNEFGLHSDEFPGTKSAINSMVPITENIVVTACEDGVLRATHLFPHRHLGIVGQHDLSVESVDICNDGTFIASTSHNNDVKFWNIEYFENFDKITHKVKHDKKKDLKKNLPSSNQRNVSDFFAGLSS